MAEEESMKQSSNDRNNSEESQSDMEYVDIEETMRTLWERVDTGNRKLLQRYKDEKEHNNQLETERKKAEAERDEFKEKFESEQEKARQYAFDAQQLRMELKKLNETQTNVKEQLEKTLCTMKETSVDNSHLTEQIIQSELEPTDNQEIPANTANPELFLKVPCDEDDHHNIQRSPKNWEEHPISNFRIY